MIVLQALAAGQNDMLVLPVNSDGIVLQQLYLLLIEKSLRAKGQVGCRYLSQQISFGERRALVAQVRRIIDQRDASGKPPLAQGCGNLKTCLAGTDNNH